MVKRLIAGVAAAALSCAAFAGSDVSKDVESKIKSSLAAAIPGMQVTSVSSSEVPGLYTVVDQNKQSLLTTADGQYVLTGDIYQLKGHSITNLSEKKRESNRAEALAEFTDKQLIVYGPEKPKATISVFTDVDCGYCRKFHREIPRLTELGIQVNYFAFPRAGVGSSSYRKIVSAWCADDPQEALTQSKSGKTIPAKNCENPVEEHLRVGQQIGVTGTPAIVLESGELLPGYMPADRLAEALGVM